MTTNNQSDEVAANLLDTVDVADTLYMDQPSEPSEQKLETVSKDKVPATLQIPQRISIPQPTATESQEVKPTKVVKANGFSALLDHLKNEALTNNQRSLDRKSLRSAA